MSKKLIQAIKQLIRVQLAMLGIGLGTMTFGKTVFWVASIALAIFLLLSSNAAGFAISYFICSTVLYIGFVFLVLPINGLRNYWIKKYGEQRAYNLFETVLALGLFHNAISLVHISQTTSTTFLWNNVNPVAIYITTGLFFSSGMIVKTWSAMVLGTELYYWKDMFFNRAIKPFVINGPYQYFGNPIYGVGQLHIYAMAIYYGSPLGIACTILNQLLLYVFYHTVEYEFGKRAYIIPVMHKM